MTYKETSANAKVDPQANVWTGTWRDARFVPPTDGGRPENALTGTIFMGNCCAALPLTVSAAEGQLRFWRSTSLATLPAGGSATFGPGLIGFEFDADLDNGFRPSGLMRLSTSDVSYDTVLQNNGDAYGPGQITHALTLYKAPSGALVFGAGSSRWSWALDTTHDDDGSTPDILPAVLTDVQQATVNLLADMNVQPLTLHAGLVATARSTDTVAPVSSVTSPQASIVQPFTTVVVSGTSSDTGGQVSGVEVSTDGGATWHRASGLGTWTYQWHTGPAQSAVLMSRAVDDSGNLEQPTASTPVTVGGPVTCPCSIWPSYAVPSTVAVNDPSAIELGVKFRTDLPGYITGIRYYKSADNTGVHTGSIWTASGSLLKTVTFSSETSSGWQQVMFDSPVAVTANTVYVASYHTDTGFYSADGGYFTSHGFDNGYLHALSQTAAGGNGVFHYGPSGFPNQGFGAANYWVDLVFERSTVLDNTPPDVVSTTPAADSVEASRTLPVAATFSEGLADGAISTATFELRDHGGALIPSTVSYDGPSSTATLQPNAPLIAGAVYHATLKGGPGGIRDLSDNPLAADHTWTFATATQGYSIWSDSAVPAQITVADPAAVELGLKFTAASNGFITGIRFYKGPSNTGTHTGHLWTSDGTLLGTVTFSSESPSGWQQAILPAPVAVGAGSVYVVSYHTEVGYYSANGGFFTGSGVVNGPLEALSSASSGGNGVYLYGASGFPQSTFNGSNYWVDVVFATAIGADNSAPVVASTTPADGATGVALASPVSVAFNEALDPATVSSGAMQLADSGGTLVPSSVTYDAPSRTVTLQPSSALATASAYTVRLVGGPGGLADPAGNTLPADITWTFTTSAEDVTPPTVAATLPGAGSVTGSRLRPIVVTFSEAMAAGSISAATLELRDGTNALVAGSVAYDPLTHAAMLQPAAPCRPKRPTP